MYKVKLSKAAKSDLKNAAFYIAYELKNEAAAKRLLDQANKQLSALSETPECCPLVRDSFLAANAVRMMTIRKYLAFYIIHFTLYKKKAILYLFYVLYIRVGIGFPFSQMK